MVPGIGAADVIRALRRRTVINPADDFAQRLHEERRQNESILLPHLLVYRPPLPHTLVSDCTVPCRYVVHSGYMYAYPMHALLWADLL